MENLANQFQKTKRTLENSIGKVILEGKTKLPTREVIISDKELVDLYNLGLVLEDLVSDIQEFATLVCNEIEIFVGIVRRDIEFKTGDTFLLGDF